MRQLSRLLSVFIALILMGVSVATASANDALSTDDPAHAPGSVDHVFGAVSGQPDDTSHPTYGARVVISRVDSKSPVYPGDTIKFRVLIIRGNHNIPAAAPATDSTRTLDSATETGTFLTRTGDEAKVQVAYAAGPPVVAADLREDFITGADFPDRGTDDNADDLVASHPSFVKVIDYKVRPSDLGDNATSRNAPIQFTLVFDPDFRQAEVDGAALTGGTEHAQAWVKSNPFNVLVEKKPGAVAGDTGVTIEFTGADPAEKVAGKSISFSLVARTTGKALSNPEVVQINRQRFKSAGSEDADKDGDSVPVNFLTIPALQTHSTSAAQKVSYVLLPEDIAAQRVEFSVTVVIDKADVSPAAGTKDTLKATHTFMAVVPVEEPEEMPDMTVGMTDSATVTKGEGDLITIERHDGGVDLSVGVGVLTSDGMVIPHMNGYIRDNDLGQTYAVVTRDDGMIVRSWISSNSPLVGDIVWSTVLDFYNVPADVVNAIPLDHTSPSENQLVDAGGTWYVYLGGAWRHIPNIATFQAYGFFYCDLTTAKAGWIEDNGIMLGQALPMTSQPEQVPYPSCR